MRFPALPLGSFLRLLTRGERWRLAGIALLVLVSAAIEVVTVAAVFPFLAVVADPDAIQQYKMLRTLYEAAGEPPVRSFLFLTGGLLVLTVVFSNLARLGALWTNHRFAWGMQQNLSNRLLRGYAAMPYRVWLQRSPTEAFSRSLTEVQDTTVNFVLPLLELLLQIVGALALFGLVVLIDPLLAVSIAVILGSAYGVLYLTVRKRLRQIAKTRLQHNRARYKAAREMYQGLKDIRIARAEPLLAERFRAANAAFAAEESSKTVIGLFPKYVVEMAAVGGILAVLLYHLARTQDLATVVPTVGLYAFAGFRMLPKLQSIFQSLTKLRVNATTLQDLNRELRVIQAAPEPVFEAVATIPAPQQQIRLQDVTFRYATGDRDTLRGVTLTIPIRKTIGIVGPSGAGKSTLVDLLLGLLAPASGTMEVDNTPLDTAGRVAWRQHVGYVPQSIFLLDDTLVANIAFGMDPATVSLSAVEDASRRASLHTFVHDELTEGYQTIVGDNGIRLSGGQRQRVGIARALMRDPPVLVFDEATSALDTVTERAILDTLASLTHERTVVVVAHRLSTVRACDHIIVMKDGVVECEGAWDDVVSRSTVLQALLAAEGKNAAPVASATPS